MKLLLQDLEHIKESAQEFLAHSGENKVFAIYGDMGAGKTTFIKALCAELNSHDVVTSPTFTLVNEYLTEDENYIYHFDFYRIKKLEEAYDFGFEEYLDSGNFCFIEWPERIESLLPESHIKVRISVGNDQSRTIYFQD